MVLRGEAGPDGVVQILNPAVVVGMDRLSIGVIFQIGAVLIRDTVFLRIVFNVDDRLMASDILGRGNHTRLSFDHGPIELFTRFDNGLSYVCQRPLLADRSHNRGINNIINGGAGTTARRDNHDHEPCHKKTRHLSMYLSLL